MIPKETNTTHLNCKPLSTHSPHPHSAIHDEGKTSIYAERSKRNSRDKQIMPPPALTETQRHFLSLYKRLLRVHEKKLPFEMRVLGNLFVKYSCVPCITRRQEFKKTMNAKPQFMNRFLYEWEAYYNDLAHDKPVHLSLSH